MASILTFASLTLLVACAGVAAAQPAPHVTVSEGVIKGSGENGIYAFRNIPFAAPPLGKLRFAPPAAPIAWRGVRDASRFGAACIQRRGARLAIAQMIRPISRYLADIIYRPAPWGGEFRPTGTYAEDCLSLNIWTSSPRNVGQPVVLFLHGGGFYQGGASAPIYNGAPLATSGVVFVSMNYRTGAAGFLANSELDKEQRGFSGNYALKDVLAALNWLHRNVEGFGGDPAKITVMGQSAGATLTIALLYSPLSKGLFRGAIIESGVRMETPWIDKKTNEESSLAWAKGKAATLEGLRRLPVGVLAAQPGDPFQLGLSADGFAITSENDNIANDVPILTGWNKDEPRHVELMRSGAAWAKARKGSKSLFHYDFEHVPPGITAKGWGSYHGAELPYVFGTLRELRRPFSSADDRIARTMQAYWVNFIRYGNPNGAGLAAWRPFDSSRNEVMALSEKPHMRPIVRK